MAGDPQPLSDKFAIVGPDGLPTIYFIQWAQQRQIDISESITVEQAAEVVAAYIADHPPEWGDIDGTLSDQTDLQAALNTKANLAGGNTFTGYQTIRTDFAGQLTEIATVDPGSFYGFAEATLALNNPLAPIPDQLLYGFGSEGFYNNAGVVTFYDFYVYDAIDFVFRLYIDGLGGSVKLGGTNAQTNPGLTIERNGDVTIAGEGFVGTYTIFNEGNLSFGTGLSYVGGVLTATGGGSGGVLPVVDGSVPPVFLQNPDGSLIYTPI